MKKYLWNLVIALDQFGNALAGGYPDETISSRLGKAERRGHFAACVLCKFLHLFDRHHCAKNIEEDEGKQGGV